MWVCTVLYDIIQYDMCMSMICVEYSQYFGEVVQCTVLYCAVSAMSGYCSCAILCVQYSIMYCISSYDTYSCTVLYMCVVYTTTVS